MTGMQTGKVSVIMPAYNTEKYIRESINSVLAQTFTDFELIVVDDGSTDATVAIVQNYTDSRIRLIRQSHQGVSAARNMGLDAAKGDYITFLDSDDLYYPDFLKTMLQIIQTTKTGMVFSNFTESYDIEDVKRTSIKKLRYSIKDKLYGARVFTLESKVDGLPINVDCVMIAKKLIEQYHIRFLTDVKMFEDGNFLFKAFLAAKKIVGTYICLAHYWRHEDSASFFLQGEKEATPVNLRDDEQAFAERYGINFEFVKRLRRYEIFKKFKALIRQKKYKEAAHLANEYEAELTCYAATGACWRDRLYCRIWTLAIHYIKG